MNRRRLFVTVAGFAAVVAFTLTLVGWGLAVVGTEVVAHREPVAVLLLGMMSAAAVMTISSFVDAAIFWAAWLGAPRHREGGRVR
jgi:hypothetical protein